MELSEKRDNFISDKRPVNEPFISNLHFTLIITFIRFRMCLSLMLEALMMAATAKYHRMDVRMMAVRESFPTTKIGTQDRVD